MSVRGRPAVHLDRYLRPPCTVASLVRPHMDVDARDQVGKILGVDICDERVWFLISGVVAKESSHRRQTPKEVLRNPAS